MLSCSLCKAYCHKHGGPVPEGQDGLQYGHAKCKRPECAETDRLDGHLQLMASTSYEVHPGAGSDSEGDQYNLSGSDYPVCMTGDTSETCGLESPSRKPDSYGILIHSHPVLNPLPRGLKACPPLVLDVLHDLPFKRW